MQKLSSRCISVIDFFSLVNLCCHFFSSLTDIEGISKWLVFSYRHHCSWNSRICSGCVVFWNLFLKLFQYYVLIWKLYKLYNSKIWILSSKSYMQKSNIAQIALKWPQRIVFHMKFKSYFSNNMSNCEFNTRTHNI